MYQLVPGSPAYDHGSLRVGDRILEVNYTDVRHASIDKTATLMTVSTSLCLCLCVVFVVSKELLFDWCSNEYEYQNLILVKNNIQLSLSFSLHLLSNSTPSLPPLGVLWSLTVISRSQVSS